MNHSREFACPETMTPAVRTYWVVQNQLLAGAYPGREHAAEHRARLQSLYDAGMRTFINLQEEGEKNNSGLPFVRYDGDLRKIAAMHNDTISHLRFPIPDGGVTSVDRDNVFSVLTRLRQADKERCGWKAPENEKQESFVRNWTD